MVVDTFIGTYYFMNPLRMISSLLQGASVFLLKKLTKREFVEAVFSDAKYEEARSGVPAAITTAQAILETGYGRSVPEDIETGRYSFNLFGIKAHGGNKYVTVWTHEEVDGQRIKIKDRFMAYDNYADSIRGRTLFLRKNARYSELFLSSDPDVWANKLQEKGYATDSRYAEKLISIMKMWGLS
jgi:type VI secretion system secreted protein VgrG